MTLATRLNGVKKPLHIMKSWELIHRVKRWFSLTIWIYAKRLSYTATSLPRAIKFGIGTRLTCDIPQVKPLNIVIKLVECNGKPVAKLSDSPGKTICHDKAFVRALRKAFDLPHIKKAS